MSSLANSSKKKAAVFVVLNTTLIPKKLGRCVKCKYKQNAVICTGSHKAVGYSQ